MQRRGIVFSPSVFGAFGWHRLRGSVALPFAHCSHSKLIHESQKHIAVIPPLRGARGVLSATLLAIMLAVTPAYASDYDVYIQSLKNGTDAQRVLARQMLPREGVRAVPDLIELLQHEDQRTWRTARNILSDICHAVTVPGFKAERNSVTDQLMELLNDETPKHAVQETLRLLGIVTPKGYDLTPIADLLKDDLMRGEAISTLLIVGTPESILLTQPYELYKPTSTKKVSDTYIQIAESILLSGGNWDTGIELYARILNQKNSTLEIQGAALTGLARFGDDTVIPLIMNTLKNTPKSVDLEAPALMGLDYMRGRASYEALLEAYPSASEQMQLGLLGVMGRKKNTIFLPLLLENATGDDPARRALAFETLVQSELPGGVDAITAYVESRPAEERKFDVEKLLTYADAMAHRGEKFVAGKAYLTLYRTTENDEFREIGFQGIKMFPTPEAYKVILEDLDMTKLDDVSAETLIALNVMLDSDEFPDQVAALRSAMLASARGTAQVQAILDMAKKQGESGEFIPMMGFVTQWHLIGSFPWSSDDGFSANPIGAPAIDLNASYDGHNWKQYTTGDMVSLIGLIGQHDGASAYGYATIRSDSDQDAQIRVGSDDGVRVWLNGASVHENNTDRGVLLDEDIVPVKLKQGSNEILVQITQGAGGWAYTLRVTKPDGTPIQQ
jgi:hypothetical protein